MNDHRVKLLDGDLQFVIVFFFAINPVLILIGWRMLIARLKKNLP